MYNNHYKEHTFSVPPLPVFFTNNHYRIRLLIPAIHKSPKNPGSNFQNFLGLQHYIYALNHQPFSLKKSFMVPHSVRYHTAFTVVP